ncbi:hypothetical protein Mapa_013917 [Marchantia paleacea]|nr:hypothetical protein Mapa_013917 [Marchantia paleacea]
MFGSVDGPPEYTGDYVCTFSSEVGPKRLRTLQKLAFGGGQQWMILTELENVVGLGLRALNNLTKLSRKWKRRTGRWRTTSSARTTGSFLQWQASRNRLRCRSPPVECKTRALGIVPYSADPAWRHPGSSPWTRPIPSCSHRGDCHGAYCWARRWISCTVCSAPEHKGPTRCSRISVLITSN